MRRTLILGLFLVALGGCGGQTPEAQLPPQTGSAQTPKAAHMLYLLGSNLTAFRNGRYLWQVHLPLAPLRSALIVDDGVVYAGDATLLFAFDAATGKQRWSASAGPDIQHLLVIGETIYVGSGTIIYAFDQQGTLCWQQSLGTQDITTQPIYDQGTLYVGNTGNLFALNAATGRVLWQRANPGWGNVQELLPVGTTLLANIAGSGVVALNLGNGNLLWQQGSTVLALALSPDQSLLYTVYIDALPAQMGLRALRVKDGTTLWKVVTPVALGEHAVITSQAFYRATGSTLGDLSAWRTSNGGLLWQIESGATITALLADAMTLYTASAEGLTARQATTGTLRWRDANLTTGGQLLAQDGILYCIGLDGQITALNASQGRVLYQVQAGYFNQVAVV